MPMLDQDGQPISKFKLDTSSMARAYVNWGKWIADCPRGCGGAMALEPHQGLLHCPECSQISPLEWPFDTDGITEELDRRPVPRTRNWFPSNHELALLSGQPHGQSVQDLREEARAHGLDDSEDVRS